MGRIGEMDNFENKKLYIWDTHMHCEMEPSYRRFVKKRMDIDKIGCLRWAYYSIRNLFDSPMVYPHGLEYVDSDEYCQEELREDRDCYKTSVYKIEGAFCIIALIWFLTAFIGGIIGARSNGWGRSEITSLNNPVGIICNICSLLCCTLMSAGQFRKSRFVMGIVYVVGAINLAELFTLFGSDSGLIVLSSLFGAFLMIALYGITLIVMIFKETRARAYFVNIVILLFFQQAVMPVVMSLVKKPFGFKLVIIATVVILVFRMIVLSDPRIHIRKEKSSSSYSSNTPKPYNDSSYANNNSNNNSSYDTDSYDNGYDYQKEYEENAKRREQERIEIERDRIRKDVEKKRNRIERLQEEIKGHKNQIEGFYKNKIGALGVDVKAQESQIEKKSKEIDNLYSEISKLSAKL